MSAPAIYHLKIERFRGIKELSWAPARGMNVILGGGDVGKTSILDALALLLSPVNPANLPDTDYLGRKVEDGFFIRAVMSLPPDSGIHDQMNIAWPWNWNGTEAVVPSLEGEVGRANDPVYCIGVRGTEDLELIYEILRPDGNTNSFPVALRRAIGLVRLSGDDRNDRDLRLVQGSALDRLLSDKGLRSRLASDLAEHGVIGKLKNESKQELKALDQAFKKENLPNGLDLAVTGSQGFSVTALIGLTADRQGAKLPLSSWGAGTRRMAALAIAAQNQGESPVTLVDEIERGLEPYRQRSLMKKLQTGQSQIFLTTHSPFVISAASDASLWYVDHEGKIGALDLAKTSRHRKDDPEAFLARLAVVAEGAAEKGFVTALLEKALKSPLEQYGVHVSDGGGQESTLDLLEALAEGGMRFSGFADEENGRHPDRWKKVGEKLGKLLFRWVSGCLEQNVISAVPGSDLRALLNDPADEKTGRRLRTLADRLGCQEKDFATIKAKAGADLQKRIIEAAMGTVPEDKKSEDRSEQKRFRSHAQDWFKTIDGGQELANKVFTLGLWPTLKPQLLPFCNAVRKAVGLAEVQDLTP
jgi:putative ATP-dependent endonuclease of the OLD family